MTAPSELTVSTGYAPRPEQAEVHRTLKRFSVLVCHRRFGKTVMCINEIIDRALRCPHPRPRYGYIAPYRTQAKQIAWDYVKHYTRPLMEHGGNVNEAELRVDLPNGARIQLFGADNEDALRGMYFDGVVLDEYAQMAPRVWSEIVRPALADRQGWAIFIGTPMGQNHFYDLYQGASNGWPDANGFRVHDSTWYAAMYRASDTDVVDLAELKAARSEMSEDRYMQEFECSWEAAVQGSYYGRLMREAEEQGRVTKVPHDPAAGVETWWDLGIGDATSIWFVQRVGREIHVIDYYEESGEALAHYIDVLARKKQDRKFIYSRHIAPHDIEQRELGTGKSRLETAKQLGVEFDICPRHDPEDGIEAVRNLIPVCWFDAERCERGINALKQYRKEWDDKRQTFRQRPLHDWTSHGADAFRYGAMMKPRSKSTVDHAKRQRQAVRSWMA